MSRVQQKEVTEKAQSILKTIKTALICGAILIAAIYAFKYDPSKKTTSMGNQTQNADGSVTVKKSFVWRNCVDIPLNRDAKEETLDASILPDGKIKLPSGATFNCLEIRPRYTYRLYIPEPNQYKISFVNQRRGVLDLGSGDASCVPEEMYPVYGFISAEKAEVPLIIEVWWPKNKSDGCVSQP